MLDFRLVQVNLEKFREHLSRVHGRQTTDVEVVVRMREAGFIPHPMGWLADDLAYRRLGMDVPQPEAPALVG